MSSGKATISFDSQRIARERARIAQERESARIADEYGRRELLRFGARPENIFDPPRVVGVRKDVR